MWVLLLQNACLHLTAIFCSAICICDTMTNAGMWPKGFMEFTVLLLHKYSQNCIKMEMNIFYIPCCGKVYICRYTNTDKHKHRLAAGHTHFSGFLLLCVITLDAPGGPESCHQGHWQILGDVWDCSVPLHCHDSRFFCQTQFYKNRSRRGHSLEEKCARLSLNTLIPARAFLFLLHLFLTDFWISVKAGVWECDVWIISSHCRSGLGGREGMEATCEVLFNWRNNRN